MDTHTVETLLMDAAEQALKSSDHITIPVPVEEIKLPSKESVALIKSWDVDFMVTTGAFGVLWSFKKNNKKEEN